MKKLLFLIFFITGLHAMQAYPQSEDSLNFTEITTTDFMETGTGGAMDWEAISQYQAWFCLFGECGGGPSVAENHQCCTIGQFFIRIFGWLGGNDGGGDPTLITNNPDGAGGGGGSGGGPPFSWGNYYGGNNPPVHPPTGGGGGSSGPSNPFVTVTAPPPTEPSVLLDDGTMIGGAGVLIDTTKPTSVICDTLKKILDSLTTKLWDSFMVNTKAIQMQDTALHGIGEVALTAYDSSGHIRIFDFQTWDSLTGFNSTNPIQTLDTSSGPNRKNVVLLAHTHNQGIDPYPEPFDLYALIERRVKCTTPKCYPRNFNHSFFLCGDTAINLALEVADTLKARFFFDFKYLKDSAVVFDTLPDGTLNPHWSNTYKGVFQDQASPVDSVALGVEFERYKDQLRLKGYPEKLISTYAQVAMLETRKTGVVMKMQTNTGKFKQLFAEITRDVNGKLLDIVIKICN